MNAEIWAGSCVSETRRVPTQRRTRSAPENDPRRQDQTSTTFLKSRIKEGIFFFFNKDVCADQRAKCAPTFTYPWCADWHADFTVSKNKTEEKQRSVGQLLAPHPRQPIKCVLLCLMEIISMAAECFWPITSCGWAHSPHWESCISIGCQRHFQIGNNAGWLLAQRRGVEKPGLIDFQLDFSSSRPSSPPVSSFSLLAFAAFPLTAIRSCLLDSFFQN